MPAADEARSLEEQIDQWRSYLRRRQAIQSVDVAELEDHLREQITGLTDAGLSSDEAFLVAVKRMGDLDSVSREFAREHSDRLWKQLVLSPSEIDDQHGTTRMDAAVAVCLAVAAAIAIKLPVLFGIQLVDANAGFYARNASFFVLPLLASYFAWKRQLGARTIILLAAVFVTAAVLANALPQAPRGNMGIEVAALPMGSMLTALHLPVGLWLAVGIAYAGGRWREVGVRMDFIRFSGELFVYYALIALGGGVLVGFTAMIFMAIGIRIEPFMPWLLPCGAAGAVLIASWLVEAKKSVIENLAPVLTRIFTPLFAALLIAFLATLVLTGRAGSFDRDALIAFDGLLMVVLGLLLYSVSARDFQSPPGLFDVLQVVLVVSALLADAVALWTITVRISEFGFTPNRVAGLGVNVILLVNLAVSTVLYIRFLRARGSFARLEKWQTDYLPVYVVWAAIVVIAFPFLFGYS